MPCQNTKLNGLPFLILYNSFLPIWRPRRYHLHIQHKKYYYCVLKLYCRYCCYNNIQSINIFNESKNLRGSCRCLHKYHPSEIIHSAQNFKELNSFLVLRRRNFSYEAYKYYNYFCCKLLLCNILSKMDFWHMES